MVAEDPLEPEHEREANLPLRRRRRASRLHLRERLVEGAPAGRVGCECDSRILVRAQEGLAGPGLGAKRGGGQLVGRLRRDRRMLSRFLHVRSACGALLYLLRGSARSYSPVSAAWAKHTRSACRCGSNGLWMPCHSFGTKDIWSRRRLRVTLAREQGEGRDP